ncbi:MAG: hypothetical protein GY859_08475 [Desulfobacterales bacterium]|nr:hypothetical protein [Desulfobacterales bacterium]
MTTYTNSRGKAFGENLNLLKSDENGLELIKYTIGKYSDKKVSTASTPGSSRPAGAAALLVGERPATFQPDVGDSGYCGHEAMNARGPVPDSRAADADLSVVSCLDYRERAFWEYPKRVTGADYREAFHCLTFHTPFGVKVKGAHRMFQARSGRKWLSLHPGGDAYGCPLGPDSIKTARQMAIARGTSAYDHGNEAPVSNLFQSELVLQRTGMNFGDGVQITGWVVLRITPLRTSGAMP